MTKLNLHNKSTVDIVSVPGVFIDRYMPSANGEFVKIYLYLLRALNNPNIDLSVSYMADVFDCPENDILRAFRYWEKNNVLSLHYDENGVLSDIQLLSLPVEKTLPVNIDSILSLSNNNLGSINKIVEPIKNNYNIAKPELSNYNDSTNTASNIISSTNDTTNMRDTTCEASELKIYSDNTGTHTADGTVYKAPELKVDLEKLRKDKDFSQLLLISQRYMGKLFKSTDCDRLAYLYELFNHSQEVIEYLVEYCVDLGHSNFNYIEKVALDWHSHNLVTVALIKQYQKGRNVNVYSIMKAFGIGDRQATSSELDFMDRWINGYKLPLEIILMACNRTMDTIHKPSFKYAESIIKNWSENNVKTPSDIEILDSKYENTQQTSNKTAVKTRTVTKEQNKFHNFEQRKYDYDALDAMLYGYSKKNK